MKTLSLSAASNKLGLGCHQEMERGRGPGKDAPSREVGGGMKQRREGNRIPPLGEKNLWGSLPRHPCWESSQTLSVKTSHDLKGQRFLPTG